LIKTAAANEARFDHDGATGSSLGLLVEESRTNLFTYSQDFSTWIMNNQSVTSNVTTAPDGTTTAYKLVESNASEFHRISISTNPTGSHTMTVFAKAAERDVLTLIPASTGGGGNPVYFDLTNGTISASLGSATSASIQALPSGWYKCSVTDTMSGFGYPFLGVAQISGTQSYQGDGTSGLYIWGAQLEAGAFPTSYIPTSGSTVTRSADVASMTGTNFSSWYNSSEGTFVSKTNNLKGLTAPHIFTLDSPGNEIALYGNTQNPYAQAFGNIVGTGQQWNMTKYVDPSSSSFAYKVNDISFVVSGGTASVDTSAIIPSVNRLTFCSDQNGAGRTNGTFARLTYYPFRLTDAQLQALTL
jgi:hypothetical protein